MASEKTKLVDGGEPKNFYFLNQTGGGGTADSDKKEVELNTSGGGTTLATTSATDGGFSFGEFFGNMFGKKGYDRVSNSLDKPRKVPVKVEPKVFFANERTFLSWLHMSVTLASISVAIVAFAEANEWSQLYGLLLMPVAIAFCVYSLWTYLKRARMIRLKHPGPYDDRVGPVVLAVLLGLSILVNFCVKLFYLSS
jgi:uncharacterized membrane protein YidH (DUF202 family)